MNFVAFDLEGPLSPQDNAYELMKLFPCQGRIPTGAGDAFAAGFLYGLFRKKKRLDECGRLGDTMARFSLSRLGTRQGFPSLNQLARRYRQLYSQEL